MTNQSAIIFKLDASQIETEAQNTARSLKALDSAGIKTGKTVEGLEDKTKKGSKELKGYDSTLKQTKKTMTGLNSVAGNLAAGFAALGLGAAIKGSINYATQLDILSEKLDISVETLSRNAYAAQTLGIEVDKLGDVYKDVSDRIGDFVQTGGGPMADFFENIAPLVGVTADQFQRLNSADALQLYISSLEKAGVSQKDMVFYLEAMSGEASALLPLLKDNGRAMRDLGDEGESLGATLDKEATAKARAANDEFIKLRNTFTGITNDLTIALAPALTTGAELLRDNAGTIATVTTGLGALYIGIKAVTAAQTAFNFAVKSNPLVSIVTLLATAGTALYTYSKFADDSKQSTIELNEEINNLRISTGQLTRDLALTTKSTLEAKLVSEQAAAEALKEELRALQQEQIKDQSGPANGILGGTSARALADYSAKQKEVNDQLKEREHQIKLISTEIDLVDKRLEVLNKNSERRAGQLTKTEQEALAESLKAATSSYDALRQAFNPVGTALDQFDSQIAALDLLLDQGKITLTEYTQGLEQASEEYNAAARAADPYLSTLDALNDKYRTGTALAQALKEQQAALRSGDQYLIDRTTDNVNDTLTADAPTITSLQPEIGGAFSELSRIEQERAELQAWQDEQLAMIKDFEAQKLITTEQAAEARLNIEKQSKDHQAELDRQAQLAQIDGYAQTFNAIGGLTAAFAGRGARITKTMLAFEQSANLAKTVMNLATAQGNAAASLPFPANLAAMATVASQTVGLIGTIASIKQPDVPNFAGMYDKGGDIPAGKVGIVGEFGPEFVRGPASVTSREKTAAMARNSINGKSVNITFAPVFNVSGNVDEDELARRTEIQFMSLVEREKRDGGAFS